MTTNELLALLALQRVPNLGIISAKKLLRGMGSAEAIFEAPKRELLKIDGIGHWKLKELAKENYFEAAEAELRFIQENNIQVAYLAEKSYPERLKQCVDAPLLLFQKGNIQLNNQPMISIVGTRRATPHGIAFCEKLVKELSPLNPIIVSGFAYGIDITAHKAALKHNLQTLACMAHGLNQVYPKPHKRYREDVEAHGGFLSDFCSDAVFDRKNFLKRNRIIAGLSEATVVIESAEKGGSLVTADIANSYNREVFAVPGRPTDPLSRGCNNLIKTQQAQAITSAADLIYMLNWDLEKEKKAKPPIQPQLFVELPPEEEKVYESLKQLGVSELDALALHCQMPTFTITPLLLSLELKGLLRPLPGKKYELI